MDYSEKAEQADVLLENNLFSEAAAAYREAVLMGDTRRSSFANMQVARDMEHVTFCIELVEAHPRSGIARIELANAFLKAGLGKQALSCSTMALDLLSSAEDDKYFTARLVHFRCAARSGAHDSAASDFDLLWKRCTGGRLVRFRKALLMEVSSLNRLRDQVLLEKLISLSLPGVELNDFLRKKAEEISKLRGAL